jgi:hypothetical protein
MPDTGGQVREVPLQCHCSASMGVACQGAGKWPCSSLRGLLDLEENGSVPKVAWLPRTAELIDLGVSSPDAPWV